MKRAAIIDLMVLSMVFWGAWSLRVYDVIDTGVLVMGAGMVCIAMISRIRGISRDQLGLKALPPKAMFMKHVGRVLFWFGIAYLGGGFILIGLFGQPTTSSAVTQQPIDFVWFLLDVTVVTWVFIAFGEELFFRGFLLHRLLVLTSDSKWGRVLACAISGAWFGSAHISQGLTGMLLTGLIGFTLGMVYLNRISRSLWPLVVVHGAVDSIVLSVAWLSR